MVQVRPHLPRYRPRRRGRTCHGPRRVRRLLSVRYPGRCGCTSAIGDHRHDGADRGDLTRRHADLGEHAGRGRRHLHRHLVGLDLEQFVAGLYRVASRLEPLRDLAFGNGLSELWHQHVHGQLASTCTWKASKRSATTLASAGPLTTSPKCTASPKIPSALHARPRGRCRTASCRRTARRDRRPARG